ncbi:hypothetical protein [Niveibacterium sp. SC-1]|uniref:hypothetical protein n=1 Tax=Niveibacterium sp. SC-1 TaxID=3135646 RepID=UPI00311F7E82
MNRLAAFRACPFLSLSATRSLALLLACASLGATACAALPSDGPVSLAVIDTTSGQPLPSWRRFGQTWIEGRPQARYALRLYNHSDARVLVVVSVDGVNAVSGETASVSQGGYVLAPHADAEINGWRKDLQQTAAFYFTEVPDSYAARTGRPDNVGVIGLAVFAEAAREPAPAIAPRAPEAMREEAAADRAKAAQPRLGTGHGERLASPSSYTEFERASREPIQLVQWRYERRARLIALGVIPQPRPRPAPAPQAFPGSFVPDPS